jgi:DEAD/DEAH box helicase domain-containing protein
MTENPTDLFIRLIQPSIVERIDVPARPERRASAPAPYSTGKTAYWLSSTLGHVDNVWAHQAKALALAAAGENVVISTGTASGKTLAFQTPIIHDLLENDRVSLVLYPQKSLSGDQLARWQSALIMAGLDPELVGEINGDVPTSERDRVLQHGRIILATADALHCWLMRQTAAPAAQRFLRRLHKVVIDEAHALEGVFGSNCVYFFRRLRSAAATAKATQGLPVDLQFIAATATIADPAGHLERLTGCQFAVVGEEDNGAPFHGLTLLHIEGPEYGAPAEKLLADMLDTIASEIAPHAAIAFADSRQGVERITRTIGRDDVLPYRSGYEGSDRRAIEAALRENKLRAVGSTSALELGIDIPQFTIGLNLGVPQTIKAFRQRAGRIGRSTAGVFVVVAPPAAFTQLGSTFRDFYEGAVEPSNLYLDNRFIQFGQARCLTDEARTEDGQVTLPSNVVWPEGFADMFIAAQPGAMRPRDLDAIAMLGSDSPHFAFPLRKIGDVTYALKLARGDAQKIGEIDIEKAMREAYPGATYYHLRRPYRVVEWRTRSFEHVILLEPVPGAPTKPILRTQVSVSFERDAVIDGRLLTGPTGGLAEISMGVCESVEGYTIGTTRNMYRDTSKTNPRLSRKQREFSTTGIVLRIDAPWFKGSGEMQVAARRALAAALCAMLARERSISPNDLRSVHSGVAVLSASGPTKVDNAIAIFDTAQGGLRLTSRLFDDLPAYLERLGRGARLAGAEALLSETLVERLVEWRAGLTSAEEVLPPPILGESDELLVYAPNSEVALRIRGTLVHRTVLEPQLLSMGDRDELMYRYEPTPGTTGWVRHDSIEGVGQNWHRMLWNPWSNELREIEA